jgi:hypothetical protein
MHAILAFLAMGLAGPAVAATEPASGTSAVAWILGVLSGVALMAAVKIDWQDLPYRTLVWVRRQRIDMQWAAFGAVCIGVLVLY